jgi:N-sulfoglucosamine sulfohydrolase
MLGLAHRGFLWNDYRRHIVAELNGRGYLTALCGVQHVAADRKMIGYEEYIGSSWTGGDYFLDPTIDPERFDRENARLVARWLRRNSVGTVNKAGRKPFFLSFGLLSSHRPFPGSDSVVSEEDDEEAFRWAVNVVDEAVASVLEAVDTAGLLDETVIIFTTDHGPPFPGMKGSLRGEGLGVALLVSIPGLHRKHRVCNALVSQIDLHPTILELSNIAHGPSGADHAGGDVPLPWEARSLLPLIAGTKQEIRESVFAERNIHVTVEPGRTVRTTMYALTRNFGAARTRLPSNIDDCPAKESLRDTAFFREEVPEKELYSLLNDPEEQHNLAYDPAFSRVLGELEEQMSLWMAATGDPLLEGDLKVPDGAIVGDPDQWSPS